MNKKIRQDKVQWLSPGTRAKVKWYDENTGKRHIAKRGQVKVWAWVGAPTLFRNLCDACDNVTPRTLAAVLHTWRRDGADEALAEVDTIQADISTLKVAIRNEKINCSPNHNFVYNPNNPDPNKRGFIATGRDNLNTQHGIIARFANVVTEVAATYGGKEPYTGLISARLESDTLIELLDNMAGDLEFLRSAIERYRSVNLAQMSTIVCANLPQSHRRVCDYHSKPMHVEKHWFAITRSDAKYCSDACRQAAYRQRQHRHFFDRNITDDDIDS